MAILGTNLVLSYREAGGSYSSFAASTNCSFDITTAQLDVTSYNSDWFKEYKNDISEWNVTCDGLISIGDYDYKDMLDAHLNRTKVTIRFTIGTPSGNVVYGYGYITSLTLNGPVEGVATYSVSIQGIGPYSFSNPSNCGRYYVTITSPGGGVVEYNDCNDGQTYAIGLTGPGSFYQCAEIFGGLPQISITSGTGTISPTGLCANQ
ncbi:MAG: phage tail tube protein [Gloeomargaritales cyanobacterium]